jgi:hypothetical protein
MRHQIQNLESPIQSWAARNRKTPRSSFERLEIPFLKTVQFQLCVIRGMYEFKLHRLESVEAMCTTGNEGELEVSDTQSWETKD